MTKVVCLDDSVSIVSAFPNKFNTSKRTCNREFPMAEPQNTVGLVGGYDNISDFDCYSLPVYFLYSSDIAMSSQWHASCV